MQILFTKMAVLWTIVGDSSMEPHERYVDQKKTKKLCTMVTSMFMLLSISLSQHQMVLLQISMDHLKDLGMAVSGVLDSLDQHSYTPDGSPLTMHLR